MPCGAVPCRAVRHCALLCRALPCCVLCCTHYFVQSRYHSKYHIRYRYYYTRFVCTVLLNHKTASPAQLSPAIPQQHSAAPCGAVPCPAVRCCTVLRYAVYFEQTVTGSMQSTRYYVPVCTCVLVFSPSFDCPLSLLFMFPCLHILHPYCRSKRDIANKHSTAQGNQICTSSSWHYQIAGCATLCASSVRPR